MENGNPGFINNDLEDIDSRYYVYKGKLPAEESNSVEYPVPNEWNYGNCVCIGSLARNKNNNYFYLMENGFTPYIGRIRFVNKYFESASDLLLYANNDFIVVYYKFE